MKTISRHFFLPFILSLLALLSVQDSAIAQNDTLKIGVIFQPPYVEIENGEYFGLNIELIQTVARNLNYYCAYTRYSNMVEMEAGLFNEEIELIANPVTPNLFNAEKFEFTHPFLVSNLAVATNVPRFALMKTLIGSIFSWSFLSGLISIVIIMLIFGFFTWYFERKSNNHHFPNSINGIWDAFWWSAVTMTTVGYGDKTPKTIGGRMVAMSWMFTALIIISSYTGYIASLLSTGQASLEYNSIDDLKKSNIVLIENHSSKQTLESMDIPYQTVSTTEDGLSAVSNGEADIFIHDHDALNRSWNKLSHLYDVSIIPSENSYQLYGFAMHKGHPLFVRLNESLIKETQTIHWERSIREIQSSKW